jgi:glucose/arabinose dehydrogenase
MKAARLALPLFIALAIAAPPPARALPKGFVLDKVADVPCNAPRACVTQMQFAPNGDLYINVRTGQVRLIRGGKLMSKIIARVDTTTDGEGGLLGLVLDPDFDRTQRLYIFRTTGDGRRDLVEAVNPDGGRRTLMTLPARSLHHGGVLAMSRDGKLFVAHGELYEQERAQDPNGLGGKVYRIERDGSVPDDNPFEGEPTWSYGHRNIFGLAVDPETGRLWETENGPSGVDDEMNLIRSGENYGWPRVQGKAGNDRYVDPLLVYRSAIVPTQMAFAGDAFPEDHRGDLFFGAYGEGTIHRLVLNDDRNGVARDETFYDGGAVVGMTFGPDGLYFSSDRAVWRIRPKQRATPKPEPTVSTTGSAPGTTTQEEPSAGGPWWPFAAIAAVVGGSILVVLLTRRRR